MGQSWREYGLRCDGYIGKEDKLYRAGWEQIRWLALHNINYANGVKRPINNPKKLITFPWEKPKISEKPTREETEKARKKLGEVWR